MSSISAAGASGLPRTRNGASISIVRRVNEHIGELNFGQRFRLNNLTQTYAKYQDMWRKKLIQKESAVQQRHFGAAAKAIETERAQKSAQRREHGAAGNRCRRAPAARREPAPFALAVSDPEHEKEKVYTLYEKLIEARMETGERAGAPSLKDFERFVRQKTQELRDKGGREVEYSVGIEGGRVKLKARISS